MSMWAADLMPGGWGDLALREAWLCCDVICSLSAAGPLSQELVQQVLPAPAGGVGRSVWDTL